LRENSVVAASMICRRRSSPETRTYRLRAGFPGALASVFGSIRTLRVVLSSKCLITMLPGWGQSLWQ
jgi:hypothetical protein